MKLSMKGQEKSDLLIEVTTWTGLTVLYIYLCLFWTNFILSMFVFFSFTSCSHLEGNKITAILSDTFKDLPNLAIL